MDISAQPHLAGHRGGLGSAGMALPAVLGALIATSALVAGLWTMASLNRMAALNRVSSVRALQLAEMGAAHTQALLRGVFEDTTLTRLLRGSDGVGGSTDDGLLMGYGLPTDDEIPAAGRTVSTGTYSVQLMDDPSDGDADVLTDSNGRILARCTGVTHDGASARIDVVIGGTPLPALVTGGNMTISDNPTIIGPCGSLHANQILAISGNPTVEGTVSAADTVDLSGSILDLDGNPIEPLHHQPPVEMPDLVPADFCTAADFVLRADGFYVNVSTGVATDATSDEVSGWKADVGPPVKWVLSGNMMADGRICAEGNVEISGNPGTAGNPVQTSIIASGSVMVSGNPYMTPSHPDGALIVAAGDVTVSGNPSAGFDNYEGLVYAGSQCALSGDMSLAGNVVCKDDPNPTGSIDYAEENKISGDPVIRSDCTGAFGGGKRRVVAWFQAFGT